MRSNDEKIDPDETPAGLPYLRQTRAACRIFTLPRLPVAAAVDSQICPVMQELRIGPAAQPGPQLPGLSRGNRRAMNTPCRHSTVLRSIASRRDSGEDHGPQGIPPMECHPVMR
ncbi:hypothetical protein [Paracoccus onubensis]|uniref:Uncharacterized protein n=1 Tax=Paracoccus onubensis TaxID=1675788 RepID=A0A418T891_9RHOB|nr:hypothetical protein [Paracoccus onubensis]RJE89383.1 hypothetical protein D3P04_01760 [Paracoccus onubensis]